ncbi:DUF2125 domain-containing protein [Methylobacterium trifolii]|uniref:DUF2125 domain-containing protein n=1 Tax=Methylobacterium trifolii TaxID=1003092 RepID=A0ABQ4TY05_9HYPH|nr:DUF2125 domain-containing protein [Methylobacterium trifolii]GJE60145.1 hypothetical protein MPOCJGCO_2255 [Methylobacterium trifolii]
MAQQPVREDLTEAAGMLPARRRSRIGLFLPYVLLLAVAVLWSAAWVYVRARAGSEMDAWIAREANAGRTWTCADRSLTGYPFRIELRCSALTLARADGGFRLGPLTALVQVYQPRHVLFETKGPFHVEQGDLTGDVAWSALEGSFHGTGDGFTRASLVVDAPRIGVAGAAPEPVAVSAKHLELHARPTPGRFESDGAVDVSLRLMQAMAPMADAFVGNADPADLALDATVNRATVLRTGTVARELERWRQAEGSLEIGALSLAKGDRRVQAKGILDIDGAHRPAGQIDLRASGVEALVGAIVGQRFGADRGALVGNLIGGLLGMRRQRDADPAQAEPGKPGDPPLKALPPLRLADGKLLFGGFPIPNVRLPVLY